MLKLLVVEDDPGILMGLEYSLNKEGFSVFSCRTQAEAMEVITRESFDLALLDLSLPDGDGYTICRNIKQRADVAIIFLTARDDETNVVMGLELGADDYITKPFRLRELITRIKTVLRRCQKGAGLQNVVEYGRVRIHLSQGKVYKDGEELFLTALEYRLLLTLVNNEGQVLSRNRLLEEIWDVDGDFVNDNTLTVYVKRLRDKVEENPQNPTLIETVRGLGYRIGGQE